MIVKALDATQQAIIHRWTGASLKASDGLLGFMELFKQPHTLADLRKRFSIDGLETKVKRLLDLNFLLSASTDEEILWLKQNCEIKSKTVYQTDHFVIFHPQHGRLKIWLFAELLEKAYRFLVARGFGHLHRPSLVFICQTSEEYLKLWGNPSIPVAVQFFVSKGRIMSFKPWSLYSFDFFDDGFFKAMVHEMVHIFLHQRYANLPLWAVEGICEYFSQPDYPIALRDLMVTKKMVSFEELELRGVHSLLDIDTAPTPYNIGYRQSHSFIDFLVRNFGEEKLIACILASGLSKEFKTAFHEYYALPIEHMQEVWRETIGNPA